VGRNVEVGGYLFARDFPEIVAEIAKSGHSSGDRSHDSSRDKWSEAVTMCAEGSQRELRSWMEGQELRSSLRCAAERIRSLAEAMRSSSEGRRDWPGEHCRTIRAEACTAAGGVGGLGLSYEVTDVQVMDSKAPVWTLEKVTFTGAAILRRDKAAYRDTWIELK
jgi:hypothetical protein